MFRRLILSIVAIACSPVLLAQETDEAIHEELRALLTGMEEAINSEQVNNHILRLPGNLGIGVKS